MEIADKIFHTSLIVFFVSFLVINLTGKKDLNKLPLIVQAVLAGSFVLSIIVMVVLGVAMVWLK